jgi:hypothetical protein
MPDELPKVSNMNLPGMDMDGRPLQYYLELIYPEIYRAAKTTVEIGMCHTRAADSIRISYESDRDGWVIEQGSIFTWDMEDEVGDPAWKEVAFIKAWGSDPEEDSDA